MSIIYNTLSRLETEGAGPDGESWSAIPPPSPPPSMGFPVKALAATLLLLFAGTGLAVWHWSDQLGSLQKLALVNMGSQSAQQSSGYQPYPVTRTAAMPVAISLPVADQEPAASIPVEMPEKTAADRKTETPITDAVDLQVGPDETQPVLVSVKPATSSVATAESTPGEVKPKTTETPPAKPTLAGAGADAAEPKPAQSAAEPGPKAAPVASSAPAPETGTQASTASFKPAPADVPLAVASVKPATTATSKAKPRPASAAPRPAPTRASSAPSPEADRSRQVDRAVEQARVALSQGRYVEALTVLNGLDPAPADRADFWLMKGSAHLGLGQLGPAETAFAAAQPLAPANAQIAVQRAILKQEQADHAGALRILEEASNRHPDVPEVFLNQGYSQHELGAVREAGHSYRIFLRLTEGRSLYEEQRRAVRQWLAQLGRGTGG